MKAFVTGTDTGVGKTTVTCALVAEAHRRGLRAMAAKPVETGCAVGEEPADALALWRAQGGAGPVPEWLCRYRYRRAASPEAALRAEPPGAGQPDLGRLRDDWATASEGADIALCEGAGGFLVPLTRQLSTADLVSSMELPLLVVARWGLGTINHTLLTIEAARSRGIAVLGFVLNGSRGDAELTFAIENASDIAQHSGAPCLGILPWLDGDPPAPPGAEILDALLASSD